MIFLEERKPYMEDKKSFSSNKKNAPTFIYEILYNKEPDRFMGGRDISHDTKRINGIDIDKNIPTDVMKELMNIKEIEMRSSCEGQDGDHPAFIIFRPENQDEEYIKTLVHNLNKENSLKAGYEKGNKGFYRVGVTWYTWYDGKLDNKNWWKNLPKKLKENI